jgi:hypothetical protein
MAPIGTHMQLTPGSTIDSGTDQLPGLTAVDCSYEFPT